MKKVFLLLLCIFSLLGTQAQNAGIEFQNTIKVEAGDSNERIIEKAAHIIPTANQQAALKNEFIALSILDQTHLAV